MIDTELKEVYKKWPQIKRYLATLGCSTIDAEDVFQEALLIFTRKKEELSFELTVEPFFYIKNTCKLLWYNEARKQQKNPKIELSDDLTELDTPWFQKEMKLRSIEKAMREIGGQCQEILQLFYGLGLNMVEIAEKVGLRNDKVAKAQKYRCLQKAKELVLESSDHEDIHSSH